MSNYQCSLCEERGKNWQGDNPVCAFTKTGKFQSENWRCATMDALRFLIEHVSTSDGWRGYSEDAGSLATLRVPFQKKQNTPEEEEVDVTAAYERSGGFYLLLTWYKDRGRVSQALTLRAAETTLRVFGVIKLIE